MLMHQVRLACTSADVVIGNEPLIGPSMLQYSESQRHVVS